MLCKQRHILLVLLRVSEVGTIHIQLISLKVSHHRFRSSRCPSLLLIAPEIVVGSDPRSRKWIYVRMKTRLAGACIQELPYNFDHEKEYFHASIGEGSRGTRMRKLLNELLGRTIS
jgi:hypothetical protein